LDRWEFFPYLKAEGGVARLTQAFHFGLESSTLLLSDLRCDRIHLIQENDLRLFSKTVSMGL